MNRKLLIGIVAVVVVVLVGAGIYFLKMRAEAAKWAEAKELVKEESSITKEGIVTKVKLVSIIDAPIDRVESEMWKVENGERVIETVKLSKLVEHEGNRKVVEMQIQALNLPKEYYTMEFKHDPAAHRITFRTLKANMQDIEGSYRFEPSPDGRRTRLIYESVSKDKVKLPVPQDIINGAMRQMFVETVRGITKEIKAKG